MFWPSFLRGGGLCSLPLNLDRLITASTNWEHSLPKHFPAGTQPPCYAQSKPLGETTGRHFGQQSQLTPPALEAQQAQGPDMRVKGSQKDSNSQSLESSPAIWGPRCHRTEASHSRPGSVQIPGPESMSIIKCLLFNATKFGVVCTRAVTTGTIVPGLTCKTEVMIH